ncbi:MULTISPECIES: iron-sulfur cluster assembly accessory protein [Bosea]|uniref:HesB/IscA family protein n=1 Tax=Bosea TaxID=85413 RepID=UPI0021506466|nr:MULTISPECIES: iron-sulfur cluster assembly accessory protein [Bosea]MCR4524066.1 iron-sulfur cluster assembly accessory protein [Bosea sp. 47.2.35]MDR6827441.1 iron-sulfur cluster assembly accessory protein [Bosea robiniae]MDR6894151.1 iron-sulfur cluster assembly accessory protein [Bosea sp. BE109]MDR7137546.1 iron-sulfur cluster assembly accessory protein [Bosea sp. BE168]MDR7174246.1 iron-sulfur cluster assembly accessory protein [Bosea sp. BE271]
MSIDLAVNPRGIAVTANAAKRIISVMAQEPPGSMLRVSVAGGGCSGFQYIFDVDRERAADDLVIERDGATVLIDETSLDLLEGCTIDFVDDLIGQSFRITNPNATSSCGCGTSFAV